MTNEEKAAAQPAQYADAVSLITKDRAARRNATRDEVSGWILLSPESRTPDQISSLISLLSLFPKLRTAGEACLASLARQIVASQLSRGDVLFRCGDTADCVYLLLEGNVVLVEQQLYHHHHHHHNHHHHSGGGGAQKRRSSGAVSGGAGDLREGRSEDVLQRFNAWELLGDEPVLAGIRWPCKAQVSSKSATLLLIPRHVFHETIALNVRASFNRKIDFLSRLPVFGNMPRRVVERLTPFFYEMELGPKDLLCRQGDSADCMWAVVNGRCHVVIDPNWSPAANRPPETDPKKTTQVAAIQSGQLFGEMCVFGNVRHRTATVRCATDVLFYRLKRLDFLRICPPAQLEELRAIAEAKMMLLVQAQREEQGAAARINRVLRGHSLRALHPKHRAQMLRGTLDNSGQLNASGSQQPLSETSRTSQYSSNGSGGGAASTDLGPIHSNGDGDAASEIETPKSRECTQSILDLDADVSYSPWAAISVAAAEFIRPSQQRSMRPQTPAAVVAAGTGLGARLENVLSHFAYVDLVDGLSSGNSDDELLSNRGGGRGYGAGGGGAASSLAHRAPSTPAVPSPTTVAALPFGRGYTFLRRTESGTGTVVVAGRGTGGDGGGDGAGGDGGLKTNEGSVSGGQEGRALRLSGSQIVIAISSSLASTAAAAAAAAAAGSLSSGDGSIRAPSAQQSVLTAATADGTNSYTDSAKGVGTADGTSTVVPTPRPVQASSCIVTGNDSSRLPTSGGSNKGNDALGNANGTSSGSESDSGGSGGSSYSQDGGEGYHADATDTAENDVTQQLLKHVPLQLLPLVDFSWNFGPCSILNVLYARSSSGTVAATSGGGGNGVGRLRPSPRAAWDGRRTAGGGTATGDNAALSDAGVGGCTTAGTAAKVGGGGRSVDGTSSSMPLELGSMGVPHLMIRRCTTPDTPSPWSTRSPVTEAVAAAASPAPFAAGSQGLASPGVPASINDIPRGKSGYAFGGGFGNVAAAVAAATAGGSIRGGSCTAISGLTPLPAAISTAAIRARAAWEQQQQQQVPPQQQSQSLSYKKYGGSKGRFGTHGPSMSGPHSSLLHIMRAPSGVRLSKRESSTSAAAAVASAAALELASAAAMVATTATTTATTETPFQGGEQPSQRPHLRNSTSSPETSYPPSQEASPRRVSTEGNTSVKEPMGWIGEPMGTAASALPTSTDLNSLATAAEATASVTAEASFVVSVASVPQRFSGGNSVAEEHSAGRGSGLSLRIQPPPPVQVAAPYDSGVAIQRLSEPPNNSAPSQDVSVSDREADDRQESLPIAAGSLLAPTRDTASAVGTLRSAPAPPPDPTSSPASGSRQNVVPMDAASLPRVSNVRCPDAEPPPLPLEPEDSVPSFMSNMTPSLTADGGDPANNSNGSSSVGGGESEKGTAAIDDDVGSSPSTFATADGAAAAAAAAAAASDGYTATIDGAVASPKGVPETAISAVTREHSTFGASSATFKHHVYSNRPAPEGLRRHTHGDLSNVSPAPNTWAVVPLTMANAMESVPHASVGPLCPPFLHYMRAAAASGRPSSPTVHGSGGGGGGGGPAAAAGSSTHLPQLRISGVGSVAGTTNNPLSPSKRSKTNHSKSNSSENTVAQSLAAQRNVMAAAAAALSTLAPGAGGSIAGIGGSPSPTANALASLLTKGSGRTSLPANVRQPSVIVKGGFIYRSATGKQRLSEMVNGVTGGGGGGGGLGGGHGFSGGGGLGAAAAAAAAASGSVSGGFGGGH